MPRESPFWTPERELAEAFEEVDCVPTPVRDRPGSIPKLVLTPIEQESLQEEDLFVHNLHHPENYGFSCEEWIADRWPESTDTIPDTILEAEDPDSGALPVLTPEDEEGLLSLCDPINLLLASQCDEFEARADQLFKALYEGLLPNNGLCNVRCYKTGRLCSKGKDHSKKASCLHSFEMIPATEGRTSRKRCRETRD